MVIDSSAILAILLKEPDARQLSFTIASAANRLLSAANFLELAIILDRRLGPGGGNDAEDFIVDAQIGVVPVRLEHARIAREAYRRFGKGNHPAKLNFGDCFAYALARAADEPLLFKGTDFSLTDIRIA